ncbi:MAG: relaxase domain-containing protein [Candidatus Dormibacteraeota bacterium]|nr:relaxase domain-containing protein [Candidatus Dormibacteraeota bacterium]
MLNIGKLGHDAAAYYLETVASGVEDYYLHAGEAPGQWVGAASLSLVLRGEVRGSDLMRLLEGHDPRSDRPLGRAQPGQERVPGYDLTFRAPKSVSLLFALGEGEVSREVRLGHEGAVRAALEYLELEAAFTRHRVEGRIVPVRADGFVAAAFQHRTSRAGDPLLHHHVVVANLVRDGEGRWGALDGRLIYAHAKTAGYLYQTELRAQLSRRLQVQWTSVIRGTAEVKGIPAEVIRAFSRRRGEILARMAERGESSAKAAQVATLDTRRAKDHGVKPAGLLPEWRARAAALGLTTEAIAATVERGDAAPQPLTDKVVASAHAELASSTGLTAHSSTFTRRDVVRALCERLGPSADAAAVERAADAFVATPTVVALRTMPAATEGRAVIRIASGRVVPSVPDECRFTTADMLATERQVIDGCVERNARARIAPDEREVTLQLANGLYVIERRAAPVPEAVVEATLRTSPSLSAEQREMVRQLTTSRDVVVMVRGHAGTGKTSALNACRHIWERSGRTVIGCSLSGRAAAELQASAGIESTTIDRLLLDLVDYRGELLPQGDGVLVVDEAGMVGTRLLARVLAAAEIANAAVVLVGDDRQLPEIDAGGAYRGLCECLGAVELVDNRRQREEWERQALVLLREGHSHEALATYVEHGRVVLGPSGDAVRARLVSDWWAAERSAGGDNVMVALRRADVRELNERARALRVAAGAVVGPTLHLPTGEFAAGDRVVTTRNRRGLGVVNGSRGTITSVDDRQRTVAVHLDGHRGNQSGALTVLPAEYLDAGHLSHGYALTGHKAQGMTADRAFVLGDEAIYREWGYVALSRGRAQNRLYVVAPELDPTDASGHGRIPPNQSESLTLAMIERALMDSTEQRLALREFEAVAGPLPAAALPPPPTPPKDLDDVALRAAAAAAQASLRHREPFPNLAEPNLVDSARTVTELRERHRHLTERRSRLEAGMEAARERLRATDGVLARRRHREERGWLRNDLSRGARDIADIDRQLPQFATRIGRIRDDRAAESGWYQRRADTAWRWRAIYDEACARIDRRVQAASAAPSIAGHAAPPPSFSAQWDWWSSAVEVERSRLWEDAHPPSSDIAGRSDAQHQRRAERVPALGKRAEAGDVLRGLDAAEDAAQRKRERHRRHAPPSYGYGHQRHLTGPCLDEPLAQQEHSVRGPRMAP